MCVWRLNQHMLPLLRDGIPKFPIPSSPGHLPLVTQQRILGHLHQSDGLIHIFLLHRVHHSQPCLQGGGGTERKSGQVRFLPCSHIAHVSLTRKRMGGCAHPPTSQCGAGTVRPRQVQCPGQRPAIAQVSASQRWPVLVSLVLARPGSSLSHWGPPARSQGVQVGCGCVPGAREVLAQQ